MAASLLEVVPKDDWPEAPTLAFSGLAGRAVALIEPHTEADPVAVLMHFLAAFANAIGAKPHALVGATVHPARLNVALVGTTAKGRKQEAWSPVRQIFKRADPVWTDEHVKSGLSTGEGLIYQVRDKIERQQKTKEGDFEMVEVDPGVEDKRLLALEPELDRVLKVMGRDGATLAAVIREAWDSTDLHIMTKQAITASGAHIAITGHITADELRRDLDETSKANGFANRFIWILVRRSKELPIPEPFVGAAVDKLAYDLSLVIGWARAVGHVKFDAGAAELWTQGYHDLSAPRGNGLVGYVLNRSEPQVLRLALVYALLDRSTVIKLNHLVAALDLWDYSERSAAMIFGNSTGDPMADTINREARKVGELTRTEIINLFGRNASSSRIDKATAALEKSEYGYWQERRTGGRPAQVWMPS
jgi:hypothetical protein